MRAGQFSPLVTVSAGSCPLKRPHLRMICSVILARDSYGPR
uniref:Uncharacterized protein n=1 Tax=uncultured Nocardioidaceae bacterium TaxID=253824 RepID=A0A6J4LEJ8_9ACTN|nr:MAG: hypothetical protein AVDCRST_MAG46-1365 [uncultured Nocardioidaceae bacterium]